MSNNQEKPFFQPVKNKYVIAAVNTGMILRQGGIIEKQAKEYLCDFDGEPQIVVGLDDNYIEKRKKECPHLSEFECEYIWTGAQFCEKLLEFDGFMLHASAVVYKDRAYLFSAPSGTGKSTHTKLWLEAFGEEKAFILNDDKPVIRIIDNEAIVFGTPWSGKTDQNKNVGVKLQGICFLERSKENWIKPVSASQAAFGVLNQTIRPLEENSMEKLLALLDKVLKGCKVWQMGCTMSTDAARMAFDAMKGESDNNENKE